MKAFEGCSEVCQLLALKQWNQKLGGSEVEGPIGDAGAETSSTICTTYVIGFDVHKTGKDNK